MTDLAESPTTTAGAVHPFRVDVPQADLDDLRRRIAATRFPGKELVADPSQGVTPRATDRLRDHGEGMNVGAGGADLNVPAACQQRA